MKLRENDKSERGSGREPREDKLKWIQDKKINGAIYMTN
jgi:hypothetical protein